MNKLFLLFLLSFFSFQIYAQGSVNCSGMAPICTDVGLNFTANAGGDEASMLDPGNNYDCLFGQPNPTWYYFQVATNGDIQMELAAASDIDFIIWGPFSSLSVAQSACGSMGNQVPVDPNNGNIVDCSFSAAAVENPVITGAIVGQVYVMLIANYAGVVQNITLSQTGGSGSTDCDIVTNPPCAVTSFIANVSGCDFATNNYNISGSVEFTNPPSTGSLVFEDCYGNTTVLASAPFNPSTVNYTIANLLANGDACTVQVYFTDESTCVQTMNYVAPACISNCPSYELQSSSPTEACGNQMYWLEIQNTGCNGFISFDVVGNYGSLWANEITWTVTSNTSGNIVAQGGPGTNGGVINISVGPLDPAIEGDLYTLDLFDAFGDGFNGTGGFIEIQEDGVVLTNTITTFTTASMLIVQPSIAVSSSTLNVTTPSGNVSSTTSNCVDHEIGIMLNNTNFCTPVSIDLPWTIVCDVTGDLISSGTQTVIVYPQVPTSGEDLVAVTWNATTCVWDISPNNDCSLLDVGNIFTITPDVAALGPYCSSGSENFTVAYLGISGSPNCCSTAGTETQITYSDNQTITDANAVASPFGGVNNAAHMTIPPLGSGGNSTNASFSISLDGYCFDPPSTQVDESYWVTVYVDGVAIFDQQQLNPPGTFNQTFTLADMPNGYNENSTINVYVYPNSFEANGVFTTFSPLASCPFPGDGNWTMGNMSVIFTATYEQTTSSPVDCDFSISAPYTCCTVSPLSAIAPADANVQCLFDAPNVDINSVTNIISDCPAVVAFASDASDGNTCPEIITRTYSVTDDCGNTINVTQTITVNDITAPTASNPAGITVECIGDVPLSDIALVTDAADNCTAAPVVAFVSDVSNGSSSNTTVYSETFDSGTIAGANPAVIYGNGGSDFNPAYALSGTFFGWFNVQNGIGDVDIYEQNFSALTVGCTVSLSLWLRGTAPLSDITITLIDDNGLVLNTLNPILTTSWQLFTINANITTSGLNFLIHYNSTGSGAGADVIMEDLLVVQECVSSVCPEVVTRTYSVTDDCGNTTNVTQTITVNDITPPIASNPSGITIECIGDIPPSDITLVADAADNCTAVPIVEFVSDVSDGNTCPEAITRTYSVKDNCGNSTNVTQTITVSDVTPPTASNPTNINIPLAPTPGPDINVVLDEADNCTALPIVAFVSEQSDGGDCPEVITRIYSVTDDCGNETLVTQLVVIGGGLVPSPTVSANGPICEGEDAVFTIDGLVDAVVTYDIGAGPTTITLVGGSAIVSVPSLSSDVTITLSSIADGTCNSIIDLSATTFVNSIVIPSFASFGPYCQNEIPDALPTTSIDGYTGTWSPSVIDVSVAGIAIYTFTPDLGQCAVPATIEVLVTPLLVPAFLQIDALCLNETAPGLPVLSQGGISGIWTPAIINTSTVGSSAYTFTPDVGQCADVATMDIEVLTLPTVIFAEEQLITCITNTSGAQIGTAGVVGNTYSWSPVTNLSNPSIGDPIANPSVTTFYTLTVTDASGCSEDGTVTVTVDDIPPVVAITNNTGTSTLTCTLVEISATATGAENYLWDNGLGNADAASIVSPGIYIVTGTSLNGCESSAEIEIIQDNGVDLFVALSEPEICSGEMVSIVANSIEASGFNWIVTQYGVTGATNGTIENTMSGAEITQLLTLVGTLNGTVEYTIVPTLGSCIGESQILTVSVLAPSTPSFDLIGPLCIGSSPPSLTSISLEGISGAWEPTAVSTISLGNTNYTFTPFQNQCALNQNMEISVNDVPVVNFSGDSLEGCAPHTVVLTSNAVGNCQWSIGSGGVYNGNQVSVVLNSAGCYDVTLQVDDGGCTNSLTMANYICLEEDPVADFSVSPDLFTDDDVLVSFTNLSLGASSFEWDFGDNNSSTYINPSNLYESTEEGAFITLTAISDFGCIDIVQMIIEYDEQEVYYIPNTFTPDGDNFNQVFTPMFYSGFDPFNFEMLIFNRWGETVFETHNAAIGWDGTHSVKGTKVADGTFTWKITYKNPKTDQRKVLVGHVTLIR